MASNRIGRINEEIRKELSALLRTVKDPRVAEAMLTITHVDTTPDLRQSRVYVSALNCKNEKEMMKGLKSAAGFLRRELPRHPLRCLKIGIVAQRETRVADNLAAPAAFVARYFQPLGQGTFLRLRSSITMARSIARSIGHSHRLRQ